MKHLIRLFFSFLLFSTIIFSSRLLGAYEPIKKSHCYLYKNKVQGQNLDTPLRIASLTKLFSSYYLLSKRGAGFQYKTTFFVDDKNDLYIQGSRDPYFLEHGIFYIIKVLNEAGIKKVRHLYFDQDFMFHFTFNKNKTAKKLKLYFNSRNWRKSRVKGNSKNIWAQYQDTKELIKKRWAQSWPKSLEFQVASVNFIKESSSKSKKVTYKAQLNSVNLIEYLKILNSYSNNITTDEMISQEGGPLALKSYLEKNLGVKAQIHTGSGLNKGAGKWRKDNYASCRDVLKVTRALVELAKKQGFSPTDLMPTAISDVGTLSQRFFDWDYAKNFVYKSGTLKQKPTSALVAVHRSEKLIITSLAQGGKRYISLKNQEKETLENVINKIGLKYIKIPYVKKDFLMFSKIKTPINSGL